VLQVEPLPGMSDTYTVPFAGAGFLVYLVDQQDAPSSWWSA
jgi:hypothetical protein